MILTLFQVKRTIRYQWYLYCRWTFTYGIVIVLSHFRILKLNLIYSVNKATGNIVQKLEMFIGIYIINRQNRKTRHMPRLQTMTLLLMLVLYSPIEYSYAKTYRYLSMKQTINVSYFRTQA